MRKHFNTPGKSLQMQVTANNPVIKISRLLPYTNKKGVTNAGCLPVDSDLYTELDSIKKGTHKLIVEQVRTIVDKEERNKFKQRKLYSLAISGVFRKWRNTENLVNHTHLLNIDIDDDHNPHITNWSIVRDELSQIQNVVAAWLSVSGKGVTLVVKIIPEKHKETFYFLSDYFEQIWGLRIDKGCNDVTRQRYTSYDPECYINYSFDKIPVIEPSEEWVKQKNSEPLRERFTITGEVDSEINFLKATADIETAKRPYTFEEGCKYFFLRALAARCNIIGMDQAFCEEMVIKHYTEETIISKADLLKPIKGIYKSYRTQHGTYELVNKRNAKEGKVKRILIKDFLHKGARPTTEELASIASENDLNSPVVESAYQSIFDEYRNEFGYNDFHDFRKAKILISRKWAMRKDVVSEQIEMKAHGSNEWQSVNINTIYCYLKEEKYQGIKKDDLKSILESDFIQQYNPFLEYFESVYYDSSEDWISKLASYVTCTDNDFWKAQFKKALVRSVACSLGKDVNRIMIVLYGPRQATGKTTFIRSLCPWKNQKYYTEAPISGNAKDVAIRLSENFIYNLEELEGFHRHEVNAFKAMISQSTIKERRAYASYELTRWRRCNFWASTNDKSMLYDTENTRWLIFEVESINWNYKTKIDINKVWAQAYYLYRTGEVYTLTAEETLTQAGANEGYRFVKAEEELIALHFEKPTGTSKGQFLTATQIAHELNRVYKKTQIYPQYIGRAVRKVFGIDSKIEWIDHKSLRGYWLINKVPMPKDD